VLVSCRLLYGSFSGFNWQIYVGNQRHENEITLAQAAEEALLSQAREMISVHVLSVVVSS